MPTSIKRISIISLYNFTAMGFMFIFSAAYGSIRQIMSDNVIIFASFLMLLGSSIGLQFGALVTRYVRGTCMRYFLGSTTLIAATGAIFKLAGTFTDSTMSWLDPAGLKYTNDEIARAQLIAGAEKELGKLIEDTKDKYKVYRAGIRNILYV